MGESGTMTSQKAENSPQSFATAISSGGTVFGILFAMTQK
jgi:hypothetical protein